MLASRTHALPTSTPTSKRNHEFLTIPHPFAARGVGWRWQGGARFAHLSGGSCGVRAHVALRLLPKGGERRMCMRVGAFLCVYPRECVCVM